MSAQNYHGEDFPSKDEGRQDSGLRERPDLKAPWYERVQFSSQSYEPSAMSYGQPPDQHTHDAYHQDRQTAHFYGPRSGSNKQVARQSDDHISNQIPNVRVQRGQAMYQNNAASGHDGSAYPQHGYRGRQHSPYPVQQQQDPLHQDDAQSGLGGVDRGERLPEHAQVGSPGRASIGNEMGEEAPDTLQGLAGGGPSRNHVEPQHTTINQDREYRQRGSEYGSPRLSYNGSQYDGRGYRASQNNDSLYGGSRYRDSFGSIGRPYQGNGHQRQSQRARPSRAPARSEMSSSSSSDEGDL